jgi:hypothetical protein
MGLDIITSSSHKTCSTFIKYNKNHCIALAIQLHLA